MSRKSFIIVLLTLGVVGIVFYGLCKSRENRVIPIIPGTVDIVGTPPSTLMSTRTPTNQPAGTPEGIPPGYMDITYVINDKPVLLKNGLSEIEVTPGSATKLITRYFGDEAFGDLDDDGRKDVAFLLTQDSGGSGTFYYIVAALQMTAGYIGTNGILLGDRIAPQSTLIDNGMIVVNYADRKPNDPFTAAPTVDVSKHLKIIDGKLVENPPMNQLTDYQWVWVNTLMTDGTSFLHKKADAFTINFGVVGKVSGTTDCNSYGSDYIITGDEISFGQFVSTLMACEGSQEADFLHALMQVDSYNLDRPMVSSRSI